MLSATLKQTIKRLQNGDILASDLCKQCLQRVSELKHLNAVINKTEEFALKSAIASSERHHSGISKGKLDGIPLAVKDNFCLKGFTTSCSSQMLASFIPPYNATVVQRLLDQGSVVIGKTNLDEFAMGSASIDSIHGPVKNPWTQEFKASCDTVQSDPAMSDSTNHKPNVPPPTDVHSGDWHVVGGSSGGSAVAVATGMAFGALGSDTGGSTRNPAAYCGVVGLKPSYGLVSRHGLIPLVNSLDVPGILARNVDDATILLNCLAGPDGHDSTTVPDTFTPFELPDTLSVRGLHVGIPKEYHAPGTTSDVLEAWQRTADLLEDGGARVTEVSLPHTQYSIVCYFLLCTCEVASNMARYDGVEFGHRAIDESSTEALYAQTRHEGFNEVVRGRILAGNYFLLKQNYEKYFVQAQKVRRLISEDFQRVYRSGLDVLLTPTTLSDAPLYSWFSQADNQTRTHQQDVFTQPVNMAGVPAVTIPISLSANGLPIGLQIIGQCFKEREMLSVAKWIEQAVNCPTLDIKL